MTLRDELCNAINSTKENKIGMEILKELLDYFLEFYNVSYLDEVSLDFISAVYLDMYNYSLANNERKRELNRNLDYAKSLFKELSSIICSNEISRQEILYTDWYRYSSSEEKHTLYDMSHRALCKFIKGYVLENSIILLEEQGKYRAVYSCGETLITSLNSISKYVNRNEIDDFVKDIIKEEWNLQGIRLATLDDIQDIDSGNYIEWRVHVEE